MIIQRITPLFLIFAGTLSAIETYYDLTIENNFGTGSYYGATPSSSDIWILSNFEFEYKSGGSFVSGNNSAGTYGTALRLSDIQDGNVRLYSTDGGTRMYAVLSKGATAPNFSSLGSKPNNYFEWSFSGNNPGTLDLSWIDSFDFLSRMTIQATGSTSPAPTTVTYGAGSSLSTAGLGSELQSYVNRPGGDYSWLGTSGYSEMITYSGASGAVRWVTNNSGTGGAINASANQSFTKAIDKAISTAASKNAWSAGSPATGPNWTDRGFRISGVQGLDPPDGSSLDPGDSARMWSAYVGFEEDGSGNYSMVLTDFTIYGDDGNVPNGQQYVQLWNAVSDAGGETYSITEDQGVLDAIWSSSENELSSTPTWVTEIGANANNFFYALYNAIASGMLYDPNYENDVALPAWSGYVPYLAGQTVYNFEILSNGASVTGGKDGFLTGDDLIALMESEDSDGTLVNPYFLELLRLMEQTPAYLYPSQDFWAATSFGSDMFVGLQPGPLNGDDVFGAATLNWQLGSGAVIPEASSAAFLMGVCSIAFLFIRRRRAQVSPS